MLAEKNIPRKQIAYFFAESLILGAVAGNKANVPEPDSTVPNGLKIT